MWCQECPAQENWVIPVGKCVNSYTSESWSQRWSDIGERKKKVLFLVPGKTSIYLVRLHFIIHIQLYHVACEKRGKSTRIIQRKPIKVMLQSLPVECELNEDKELTFGLTT